MKTIITILTLALVTLIIIQIGSADIEHEYYLEAFQPHMVQSGIFNYAMMDSSHR